MPLRRRHWLAVAGLGALACVGAPTWAHGAAASAPLWVVLSERSPSFDDAAATLRLSAGQPLVAGLWSDWALWEQSRSPTGVLLLGARALAAWGEQPPSNLPPALPWAAALVSQAAWSVLPAALRQRVHTAWLDQPLPRLADWLALALSQRSRAGALFGPSTQAWQEPLRAAMQQRQWQLRATVLQAADGVPELFTALSRVLDGSEALLLLPDAQVLQPSQFQNILIAAYRQRQPVLSFSAAHVRAGATLALYTTPVQAAQQGLELLRRHGNTQPARQQWAAQFELAINEPVARSLNLHLPGLAQLSAALMQRSPDAAGGTR